MAMIDEFFTGNTHDCNFDAMMKHYAEVGCDSIHADLNCFWKASGLSAEHNVAEFFAPGSINSDVLAEPPMSAYKSVSLD